MILPSAAGSQVFLSWSTVRQVAQSFSVLAMTVMASTPTWNSTYSTPASAQRGTSSSSSIGRDAFEMSVSSAQKRSKPPPVPDVPTSTLTFGCSSR